MKNAVSAFLIAHIVFAINSCDILEVKKDYTYEIEIPVNGTEQEFTAFKILDISSDSSEFEEYDHMIESAEITKIEYTIAYFSEEGSQIIQSAILEIADTPESESKALCTLTDVDIHALSNQIVELPVDYSGIDSFQDLVNNNDFTAHLRFHGKTNSAPTDFRIKFILTVTVTGQLI